MARSASLMVPLAPPLTRKFADWFADPTSVDGKPPPSPLCVHCMPPAELFRLPERVQTHWRDAHFQICRRPFDARLYPAWRAFFPRVESLQRLMAPAFLFAVRLRYNNLGLPPRRAAQLSGLRRPVSCQWPLRRVTYRGSSGERPHRRGHYQRPRPAPSRATGSVR